VSDVAVVLRESLKVEQVLALVDAEGEFLETAPEHRDCRKQDLSQLVPDSPTTQQEELVACRVQLQEVQEALEASKSQVLKQACALQEMQRQLDSSQEIEASRELEELRNKLAQEKERTKHNWSLHCQRLAEQDARIAKQDDEVERLSQQIATLRAQLEVAEARATEAEIRPGSGRHTPIPTTRETDGRSTPGLRPDVTRIVH